LHQILKYTACHIIQLLLEMCLFKAELLLSSESFALFAQCRLLGVGFTYIRCWKTTWHLTHLPLKIVELLLLSSQSLALLLQC
jgi:hypothetical protein